MNLVFIYGKIVEDIKFDFIINGKHNSIARFKIQLNNKHIVQVIGYDEIADFCYQNLGTGMQAWIEGKLTTKMQIEILNIRTQKI